MKKYIAIALLVYFALTAIDMIFGENNAFCNAFYFIKENAIAMFLCLYVAQEIGNITACLISYCGVIFFGERILFNIFLYDYSNSSVFGLIFVISIFVMLLIVKVITKWT